MAIEDVPAAPTAARRLSGRWLLGPLLALLFVAAPAPPCSACSFPADYAPPTPAQRWDTAAAVAHGTVHSTNVAGEFDAYQLAALITNLTWAKDPPSGSPQCGAVVATGFDDICEGWPVPAIGSVGSLVLIDWKGATPPGWLFYWRGPDTREGTRDDGPGPFPYGLTGFLDVTELGPLCYASVYDSFKGGAEPYARPADSATPVPTPDPTPFEEVEDTLPPTGAPTEPPTPATSGVGGWRGGGRWASAVGVVLVAIAGALAV